MQTLVALLWQTDVSDLSRPDLTVNYYIIAVLLVIALILSVLVVRRRMSERDDDWDG